MRKTDYTRVGRSGKPRPRDHEMRHGRVARRLPASRGAFDARPRLDYLANVINAAEKRSMSIDRHAAVASVRPSGPRCAGRSRACAPSAPSLLLAAAPAIGRAVQDGRMRTDGSSIRISRRRATSRSSRSTRLRRRADPNAVKDLANKEVELQKKKLVRAEDDTKANKARVDANLTHVRSANGRAVRRSR